MEWSCALIKKVVHITWIDSQTDSGWTPIKEVAEELELTHTIGFFVSESDAFYIVAHSFDPQTESVNGLMTIPKSAVETIKTLKRVKL